MRKLSYLFILIALVVGCVVFLRQTLENNSADVPVRLSWQLIQNDVERGVCESQLTIHNLTEDTLRNDWELYYCQLSLAPIVFPEEQIHVEQICASYHKVTPTACYAPIAPYDSATYTLHHKGSVLRKNGAPQGAYFVWRKEEERSRKNDSQPVTVPVEVIASADGSEYRRGIPYFPYADGEWIYQQNLRFAPESRVKSQESGLHLLPTPKACAFTEGVCHVKNAIIDSHLLGENGALFMCREGWRAPEGYSLRITSDTIHILAPEASGAFYARQTIAQLDAKYNGVVPCCEIIDYPDFHHRGLMLDIVRNFTCKEDIYRIIDDLALYKMNVLHLHLSDDEAWRLEIPDLPELTEVGSRRGHTTDERDCLFPAYNGGWDMNDLTSTSNGYLTREEFIAILRYANERHIRVIPEIDMPGHMRAAIKSMEARYHKYIASDPHKATEYLLTDFNDTSKYESAQHYTDNVLCIALPSCYTFIQKVIDEVVAMYKEAEAPLYVFHVGGDEVPRNAWTGSPLCQAHMQAHGMESTYDLKDAFIAKVLDIVHAHNLQCEGWEEIAMRKGVANPRFADANVLSHCWNSIPEWKGDEVPYRLANAGYQVLLGCVGNLYLDMSYLNHEDERALHWGGYTDEYTTFDFQPFDLYRSVRRTMLGKERDIEAYANSCKVQLLPEAKRNIIGLQAQLFAETIRSSEQLEDYIFPKIFGVAERAWNAYPAFGVKDENYLAALNTYNKEITDYDLPWLSSRGRHFYLTQPGIHRSGDTIYMNAPAAHAEIRYTTDGSEVTLDSPLYTGSFVSDAELIHARTFYCGMMSNTTHSRR